MIPISGKGKTYFQLKEKGLAMVPISAQNKTHIKIFKNNNTRV